MSSERSQASVFDRVWNRDALMTRLNPAQAHRRRLTVASLQRCGVQPADILDIGCGMGGLLMTLSRAYPSARLHGCDVSVEAGRILSGVLPKATFRLMDAQIDDPPEMLGRFDVVVCSEVLEHCERPENVADRARRWLRPHGVFFLTVPSGAMTAYDRSIGHLRHYRREDVEELLRRAGFDEPRVECWGWPFHTIYRRMVGWGSERALAAGHAPTRYLAPFAISSAVFWALFYLNQRGEGGQQLLGWART